MDRIRKEFIKGTAHARCFGGKAREGRGVDLSRGGTLEGWRDGTCQPGEPRCCRRGQEVGWCERRNQMMGEMEEEDLLRRPLRGKAERRKSNNVDSKLLYNQCRIRNSISAVNLSF